MRSLRHIWFIALKDMRLFVTDRLALLFFLAFPFLFIALFSFILFSSESQDTRMYLHLVTLEDEGGVSRLIIEALETEDESELDPGEPVFVWDDDYDQAYQAVTDGEIEGFLLFPEDFTEAISLGYGSELVIVTDPEATYTRAALESVADTIATQIGLQQVARRAITALTVERWFGDPSLITGELAGFLSVQGGVQVRQSNIDFLVEKVGEVEGEEPSNYVVPGYLVMFVFMAAAFSAETIVRERKNGTLERLIATSVKKEAILGGVFLGTAAKGLVQIIIFWAMGILVFNMDMGLTPGAVVLLSVLMVIMSAAFAVMLATLARSERAAGSIALFASLVLAPLGGCWWPLFITPQWMQFLAKFTPHGWATTGFNKLMLFSGDFAAATPEMLALCGFTVLFGIIALWRFRTSAV